MTRRLARSLPVLAVLGLAATALLITAPPAAARHIKEDASAASRIRLLLPVLNPERGRDIFVSKGCIACHSINGTGGDIGPALDAPADNRVINPFSFAANMWNHAPGMIAAQEDKLGEQIHFTGEELGDIIAFIQDDDVQRGFGKSAAKRPIDKSMPEIRLIMPIMDPTRGKSVFVNNGCVTCHAVNGVGGEDAPSMDSHTKEKLVNPFAFAAKMWDHAPGMIAAQEDELGEQVIFTGEELADITAFVHDAHAQRDFELKDLTPRIRRKIAKMNEDSE